MGIDFWYPNDPDPNNDSYTKVLPGQPELQPSTSNTAVLPYEAVNNGIISKEDMEKVLRAMSFLSFVGPVNKATTYSRYSEVDPNAEVLVPSLPDVDWYNLNYISEDDRSTYSSAYDEPFFAT